MKKKVARLFLRRGDLPPRLRRMCDLGFKFRNQGDREAALKSFQGLIDVEPRFAIAWFMIGVIEYELDRMQEAAASLSECVRRRPRHSMASRLLFHALFNLGRVDQAYAEIRRFLRGKESPEYRQLLADYARSLRKGGDDPVLEEKTRMLVDDCAEIPIRPQARRQMQKKFARPRSSKPRPRSKAHRPE